MIHNSGIYGQNEVPGNINSNVNVPQINSQVGSVNNLSKYLDSGESSTNSLHSQQEYNNHLCNGLNMGHFSPYSHMFPFSTNSDNLLRSYLNTSLNEIPNVPMNLNVSNSQYDNTKQYSKKNNIDLSNFYYRKNPSNTPQSQSKNDKSLNSNIINPYNNLNEDKIEEEINHLYIENEYNDDKHIENNTEERNTENGDSRTGIEDADETEDSNQLKEESNNLNNSNIKEFIPNPYIKDLNGRPKEETDVDKYTIFGVEEASNIVKWGML